MPVSSLDEMTAAASNDILKIFDEAQFDAAHHTKLVRSLWSLYTKADVNDFGRTFNICMKYALAHSEREFAVRVLDFVAKFCGTVEQETVGKKSNEPMSPFIRAVLDELLKNCDNQNPNTRMKVCYTVQRIMCEMGPDASIDADVWNKISAHMLKRVKDKSPSVRVQAVAALERIQDPSDPNCFVVGVLLSLLQMDESAEVRRAVLLCLGRTKCTLPAICARIHDIKDIVRKQAYISLSKVSIRTHTIQQRKTILNQGLNDRSDMVRKTVEGVLLPSWLENCHRSFMEFLHALDLEHSSELADKALKVLFKGTNTPDLIQELQLDSGKLIPSDKLTLQLVFYWRCLAEYLEKNDELELVVPELTIFCEYIESNMGMLKTPEVANPWNHTKEDFIMAQLLELTRVFDYADEVGRETLKMLLLHMLASHNVRFQLIHIVINIFSEVVPDVDIRLQLLMDVVSDIHEPLRIATRVEMSIEKRKKREYRLAQLHARKNILEDAMKVGANNKTKWGGKMNELSLQEVVLLAPSATVESKESECTTLRIIAKCLQIIYDMIQCPSITALTPQLRIIKETFVLCNMKMNHVIVQVLALQCMGAFGCIDRESASEAMFFFSFHLGTNSTTETVLTALKGVLDLWLIYGLKTPKVDEIYAKPTEKKALREKLRCQIGGYSEEVDKYNINKNDDKAGYSKKEKDNNCALEEINEELLYAMVTGLIDEEQGPTLHCVVEGLCKLLLAVQIRSSNLVSRLTLLWFNPVYDDDTYLRQVLGQFFKMYSTECPVGQHVLEQSFLPSVSTVLNAPPFSPLARVNAETVARFLLELTKCDVNRFNIGVNVHNNLAIQICNEIIKESFKGCTAELIQIVCFMDLSFDECQKMNILQMISHITPLCPDKSSICALAKLENFIKTSRETSTTGAMQASSTVMSEYEISSLQNSRLVRSKAQRSESNLTVSSASSVAEEEDENDFVFGDNNV